MWNFSDRTIQRVKGVWFGTCEVEWRNRGVDLKSNGDYQRSFGQGSKDHDLQERVFGLPYGETRHLYPLMHVLSELHECIGLMKKSAGNLRINFSSWSLMELGDEGL